MFRIYSPVKGYSNSQSLTGYLKLVIGLLGINSGSQGIICNVNVMFIS